MKNIIQFKITTKKLTNDISLKNWSNLKLREKEKYVAKNVC